MAKILLAEDEPDIRMMVRLLLSADPSLEVVAEAVTPDQALAAAAQHQPDLIVLDQGFKGEVTGLDIAPQLRSAAPKAKIILFSAYDNLEHSVADIPEIDAFVLKTKVTGLLSVVQQVLTP